MKVLRTYQSILSLLLVVLLSVTLVSQTGICTSFIDMLTQTSEQEGCCPSLATSSDTMHNESNRQSPSSHDSMSADHSNCECCSCGFVANSTDHHVFVSVSKQSSDKELHIATTFYSVVKKFAENSIAHRYHYFETTQISQRSLHLMNQVFLN